MIALSDIVILTVSSALLVVALMRAYAPNDARDAQQQPVAEVRQQSSQSDTLRSSAENSPSLVSNSSQSVSGAANNPSTAATTAASQNAVSASVNTSTGNAATSDGQSTGQNATAATSTQVGTAAAYDTYTVQSGDSLSVIAERTGTSVQELQAINQLSSTVIQIGQNLRYPKR